MPSTSAKQAKFMRAVAHSPKFAKKVGVPQSVGKDFEMADKKKMKKFASAGKVGRKATEQAMTGVEDILKSAPSLVAAAQSDKAAESAMKSAVAPARAQTFGEAFKAARKDPEAMKRGTFTWGGKTYTTKMAGEGTRRSSVNPATALASQAVRTPATPPATPTSGSAPARTQTRPPATSDWRSSPRTGAALATSLAASRPRTGTSDALLENITRRNKLTPAAPKPGLIERYKKYVMESSKSPNVAEIQTRLKTAAAQKKAAEEAKQRKALEEAKKATREYERRTGKPLLMRAKGGSVDGCAIRGKTRAMKKGK